MHGFKAGILGLALSSFIGNAWAEDVCARVQDITAMQAAAVQQELVVAAFSCNDYGLYNSFVIGYQKALQESDRTLQAFFLRLNAATGAADYHTFKTKLANSYSLRSSGNMKAFCGLALQTFHAALNEGKKSLAEFVLAQPVSFAANYDGCGERIAGGAMVAQTAPPAAPPPVAAALEAPAAAALEVTAATAGAATTASVAAGVASEVGEPLPDENAAAYPARTSAQPIPPPPPPPPPPQARRYDARDRYERGYGDSYGYSNRYGERDPYYRNAYDRYWSQYYYLRRR